MIKLRSSQDGFGLIEGLLAVIAITLMVGVGVYIKNSDSNKNVTTKTASQPTVKKPATTKVASDTDLIVAAVKSYTGASATGASQQSATVDPSNITIVGDNAKGSVAFPPDGGGAAFIAHKDNGTWKVIFEGQQAPDPSLGAQYGLPIAWYSAN
jgi:hypothetical protein